MYIIGIFSVCKYDSLSCGLKLLRFITILKVSYFCLQRSYYSSSRYSDSSVTLLDCLSLFTKKEELDGDEKPVSNS